MKKGCVKSRSYYQQLCYHVRSISYCISVHVEVIIFKLCHGILFI